MGGGFLVIPALVLFLGLPMTVAVGTSLVIVALNSAAGFAAYMGEAAIDFSTAGAFTIAAVAGSAAAGRLASRLAPDRLRRGFAYLVSAVAAFIVAQVLLNPSADLELTRLNVRSRPQPKTRSQPGVTMV